jgi:hypothetical protein
MLYPVPLGRPFRDSRALRAEACPTGPRVGWLAQDRHSAVRGGRGACKRYVGGLERVAAATVVHSIMIVAARTRPLLVNLIQRTRIANLHCSSCIVKFSHFWRLIPAEWAPAPPTGPPSAVAPTTVTSGDGVAQGEHWWSFVLIVLVLVAMTCGRRGAPFASKTDTKNAGRLWRRLIY